MGPRGDRVQVILRRLQALARARHSLGATPELTVPWTAPDSDNRWSPRSPRPVTPIAACDRVMGPMDSPTYPSRSYRCDETIGARCFAIVSAAGNFPTSTYSFIAGMNAAPIISIGRKAASTGCRATRDRDMKTPESETATLSPPACTCPARNVGRPPVATRASAVCTAARSTPATKKRSDTAMVG